MSAGNATDAGDKRLSASQKLLFFFLLSFICMGLPRTFTTSAAFAIFIDVYGAELLPLSFIITSFLIPLLGYVFLKFEERVALPTVLAVSLVLDALVLAIVSIGLRFDGPDWLALAAAVWAEVEWVLTSLVFWGLAERVFNLSEAKRSFGHIASGEPLAAVAGGLMVPPLLKVLTPLDLMLVSAASLVAGAAMTLKLARRYPSRFARRNDQKARAAAQSSDRASGTGKGMKSFLAATFVTVVICDIAYFSADMIFFLQAELYYPDPARLAAFIALVQAALGVFAFICNVAVSRWLTARFGLRTSLNVLPVLLGLTALLILAGLLSGSFPLFVFGLAIVISLINESVYTGIYRPAFLTLLQPLPGKRRIRVQTLSESIFAPIGGGVAGLALLGLMYAFEDKLLVVAIFLVVAAGAWIFSVRAIHTSYLQILSEALGSRFFGKTKLDFSDAETRRTIIGKLASERANEVVTAIELLETAGDPALMQEVPGLLSHDAPEVRIGARRQLQNFPAERAVTLLGAQLKRETEPAMRVEIIRMLGDTGHDLAARQIKTIALEADGAERSWALTGLIRSNNADDVIFARTTLSDMARSQDPEVRRQVAVLLGETDAHSSQDLLVSLLEDPRQDVRHQALRAAGMAGVSECRPYLIKALCSDKDRKIAASALAAAGEGVLADLNALYNRSDTNDTVRQAITGIYGAIGGNGATARLEDLLNAEDPLLRPFVVAGLHQAGYRCTQENRMDILRAAGAVIHQIALYHRICLDLAESGLWGPLERAISQAIARHEECLFRLVGFTADPSIMDRAWLQFANGNAEQVAYAVEMICSAVPVRSRRTLADALEPYEPEERVRRLSGLLPRENKTGEDHLAEIANGTNWTTPWMRACALYQIGAVRPSILSGVVLGRLGLEDGLVGETARWVTRQRDIEGRAPIGVEKVIALTAADIFQSVADEDLLPVAMAADVRTYEDGAVIIRQGALETSMYVVHTGKVRVVRDGRQVAVLGDGQVFGEMAALDPARRSATVEAVGRTDVFVLDNEHLEDLIGANAEVGMSIIAILIRRIRSMTRIA